MLYTICVLIFGVYIGQEYPNLPSIHTLAMTVLNKFQQNNQDNSDNSNILKQITMFFKGINNDSKNN
jgi:hypothetical protein